MELCVKLLCLEEVSAIVIPVILSFHNGALAVAYLAVELERKCTRLDIVHAASRHFLPGTAISGAIAPCQKHNYHSKNPLFFICSVAIFVIARSTSDFIES